MTAAVKVVIDGRTLWFIDDLYASAVPERFRSMRVLDGRGRTDLVEVDIVERRSAERDGALAAGTVSAPCHEVPDPDEVVTVVENVRMEKGAAG